jgi:sugar O-acyltransferase (sialic acid O-acetyltransferase NeuD family)
MSAEDSSRAPSFAIYGTGGCARGVVPLVRARLSCAQRNGELVLLDDAPQTSSINGHRVLRYEAWLAETTGERFVSIAIADGRARRRLANRCEHDGVRFFEVRAQNVVELDDVRIGEGAVLCPFVTLTSNIRIGVHFHANLYSYVEHDCTIGDYVTFAPGVHCNGNVVIEDHAYIGSGAILRNDRPGQPLVIGRGAIVGMGAVVTRSVPADCVVAGNPARPLASR